MTQGTTAAHDVVVVGAGPVGLALVLALRRAGVDAVALDRGTGPTTYPKSRLVSVRSMELLRRWGLADAVRGGALGGDWCDRVVVGRSVTGGELTRIENDAAPVRATSPERPALCTQDVLEHILAAEVQGLDPAGVHWRSEVVDLAADDEGVTVSVRRPAGSTRLLRARYVACADGVRGLGAGAIVPGAGRRRTIGRQVSVLAQIDLEPWTTHRPAFVYYLIDRRLAAQLLVVDGGSEWVVSALARRGETAADYPVERARALLAAVVGLPARDPVIATAKVRDVRVWDLALRVADTFCNGRVLRAGDAAHEILPTGAMGLNLGMADADALAWRLIAVLRGWAGPALLADYERERRAVALSTADWSRRNLNAIAAFVGAAARDDRAALEAAVPALAGYLDHSGLEVAGHRAPHLWIDGEARSTLDLYGTQPVLLVDRMSRRAADSGGCASDSTGVPLTVVKLGEAWWPRHGVGRAGAVLVRPDGYVCWRTETAGERFEAELAGALRGMAGRDRPAVESRGA